MQKYSISLGPITNVEISAHAWTPTKKAWWITVHRGDADRTYFRATYASVQRFRRVQDKLMEQHRE